MGVIGKPEKIEQIEKNKPKSLPSVEPERIITFEPIMEPTKEPIKVR